MPWWGWLLVGWVPLAAVGSVLLGKSIKIADEHRPARLVRIK